MKDRLKLVLLLAFVTAVSLSFSLEARRKHRTYVNINVGETRVVQQPACYAVPVVPVAPVAVPVTPYYYAPVQQYAPVYQPYPY